MERVGSSASQVPGIFHLPDDRSVEGPRVLQGNQSLASRLRGEDQIAEAQRSLDDPLVNRSTRHPSELHLEGGLPQQAPGAEHAVVGHDVVGRCEEDEEAGLSCQEDGEASDHEEHQQDR